MFDRCVSLAANSSFGVVLSLPDTTRGDTQDRCSKRDNSRFLFVLVSNTLNITYDNVALLRDAYYCVKEISCFFFSSSTALDDIIQSFDDLDENLFNVTFFASSAKALSVRLCQMPL